VEITRDGLIRVTHACSFDVDYGKSAELAPIRTLEPVTKKTEESVSKERESMYLSLSLSFYFVAFVRSAILASMAITPL
jgi:hypothetical protein